MEGIYKLILENLSKIVKIKKKEQETFEVEMDEQTYNVKIMKTGENKYTVTVNNTDYNIIIDKEKDKIIINGIPYSAKIQRIINQQKRKLSLPTRSNTKRKDNTIYAPITGKVVEILVKKGDTVKKEQTVAIIESMKIRNEIRSHLTGKITKIYVKENDVVKTDEPIIEIEANN